MYIYIYHAFSDDYIYIRSAVDLLDLFLTFSVHNFLTYM